MRKIIWLSLAFMIFGTTGAYADAIFVNTYFESGPIGNPSDEADWIETILGLDYDLVFLYKNDAAAGDVEGAVSASHFTAPLGTGSTGISWDLTSTGYELYYILLKDGSHTDDPLSGHLYTLYSVTADQFLSSNGTQTVGFVDPTPWPPPYVYYQKSISHISFFGVEGQGTGIIPEPGTLLLLGTGVVALGILGRRRFR